MARIGAAAVLLATGAVAGITPRASGEESTAALRARMDSIQAELDATTARLDELQTRAEQTRVRIAEIEDRRDVLMRSTSRLHDVVAARADALYRAGGTGMMEALFESDSIAELSARAEILSQVSVVDSTQFVKLARARAELAQLGSELEDRRADLTATASDLGAQSDRLQAQFASVSAEYERVRARLAAQAVAVAPASSAPAPARPTTAPITVPSRGGMTCPVAGPVSFVDSWHAPRDGHLHEGVDMMSPYGTPVVAITSGTVTYAAYDGSGGNMIFLTGDDGNAYWYMHNQQNLVTGGHVSTGQQIATVGDTGNAVGTPHVHFEYHPGGGEPVDPYPLVASLC